MSYLPVMGSYLNGIFDLLLLEGEFNWGGIEFMRSANTGNRNKHYNTNCNLYMTSEWETENSTLPVNRKKNIQSSLTC